MNKIKISRGSVIRRCTWWRGILNHLKHVSSLLSGYSSDFRGRDFYTCYIILDVFKIPTPSGKQRVKVAACEQTYHFERREKKVARERPSNWQSRGGWQGKLFLSPPPPPPSPLWHLLSLFRTHKILCGGLQKVQVYAVWLREKSRLLPLLYLIWLS